MMAARQALYVACSLAFRPPSGGHVEGGLDNALLGIVAEAVAHLGYDVLKQPLAALGEDLTALARGDLATAVAELEGEYNRLFVGPMPPLASPYESVYRTPGGLVMGDCAIEVLQAYAEAGFVLRAEYKDLPDHIAVELEYMAILCQREGEAGTAGLEERVISLRHQQADFLEGHLRRWVPQFCQRILLAGAAPFYSRWVQLADLFTNEDARRLRGGKELQQ